MRLKALVLMKHSKFQKGNKTLNFFGYSYDNIQMKTND